MEDEPAIIQAHEQIFSAATQFKDAAIGDTRPEVGHDGPAQAALPDDGGDQAAVCQVGSEAAQDGFDFG